MVITQTLGASASGRVDTVKGRKAILKVKNDNKDISAAINAAVKYKKPKGKKRIEARQRAILKAEKRNPAFRTAIEAALTRLVGQ